MSAQECTLAYRVSGTVVEAQGLWAKRYVDAPIDGQLLVKGLKDAFDTPIGRVFTAWGWLRILGEHERQQQWDEPVEFTLTAPDAPDMPLRIVKRIDKQAGWCSIMGVVQPDWSTITDNLVTGGGKHALKWLARYIRVGAVATLQEMDNGSIIRGA